MDLRCIVAFVFLCLLVLTCGGQSGGTVIGSAPPPFPPPLPNYNHLVRVEKGKGREVKLLFSSFTVYSPLRAFLRESERGACASVLWVKGWWRDAYRYGLPLFFLSPSFLLLARPQKRRRNSPNMQIRI